MTFLQKYELIRKSVPVPAVSIDAETVNCELVDDTYGSKNCYYCFNGFRLTDSMYVWLGWGNKLVDCSSVTESERCYKCIDCTKCFNSTYLIDCNNTTDCHYSAFLNSCTDCFGCVTLTHKKYCIFNKQYTKEEYFKKIEILKREEPRKLLEQMFELKSKIPHPASQQFNNENSPYGDYVYNSKNSYWCFNSYYMENSGYAYTSGFMKNCWDSFISGTEAGDKSFSEQCYELTISGNCFNCTYMVYGVNCTNCHYSSYLTNCTDCFGCVGLSNKKYCILNNQLTKEQYEKSVVQIKKELGWKV